MSPFNLGYQAPACKVVLISQSGLHFRLRHDAVNEKTCIFHHATRLRTSQSTYLDIGTSLYVQLDVDSVAVHTNVNDMVLRHFADLVTGKPLLSLSYLDSHLSSQSAQGNTGQSYLTDAHLAEIHVANLRRLLQMLTDFECPKRLRGIAVGHYRPAFALAPWHAFVAASDGPDIAMAQLAVAALGTQRAGNGTYKDWRPYALTIEEIKSIPLEWYVALVRVVSKWEAKNGNHKLVAKDRQGELIAGKAWSSVAHSFMLEVTGKPGPVHPMKAGLSTVVRSTNVANPATPATTAFASPSPAIPSHPPGRESVLQTPAISEANSIRTPPAEIVGTPRSPCRKLTSAAIDRSSNDNNEVMGAQAEESVWLVDLYDDEEEITKGVADDSIVVQLLLKETGDYACPDDEHDVHIIDVEGHGPISAMSEDEIVELFLPVREAADRVQSALECTM